MSRAVVVSHLYPRPGFPVGGRFVADSVAELVANGLGVEVLVPTPWAPLGGFGSRRWEAFAATPRVWEVDGLPVRRVWHLAVPGSHALPLTVPTLAAGLRLALRRPAVPGAGARPHPVPRRGRHGHASRRAAAAGHLDPWGGCAESERSGPAGGLLGRVGRRALRRADVVVVNSNRTKIRVAAQFGLAPERMRVVPPGIASSRLATAPKAKPGASGRCEIVAVGNLVALKGHAGLLRALAEDSVARLDWHFTVVGSGPERSRLAELAVALKIAHRVSFVGQRPPEEIAGLLGGSRLFDMTSVDEAWGIAWAEAQFLGLPAIACREQGTAEIIRDGENGFLVEPGEVAELADRLATLIANRGLRARMGACGIEVGRGLSLEDSGQALVDAYQLACDRHG